MNKLFLYIFVVFSCHSILHGNIEDYPSVEIVEHFWIPLQDGTQLAAKM